MGRKIDIHPGTYILLAAWVMLLPFRFLMGALLAAAVHEGAHYLAVRLSGGEVYGITLGFGGARMDASPLPRGRAMLCALAGPLGSFSMLLFLHGFPEAALCGLVQGCYNLLPLWPLDGGRALRCCLREQVYAALQIFVYLCLSGICLWMAAVWHLGVISLFFPVFLLVQRKLACKEPEFAVQ